MRCLGRVLDKGWISGASLAPEKVMESVFVDEGIEIEMVGIFMGSLNA